jgi:hypothetical protein
MARPSLARDASSSNARQTPEKSMISGARGWFVTAVFLTCALYLLNVRFPMRRSLRIRIEFAPSRLSTQHLHIAYEVVAPVTRRAVREPIVAVEPSAAALPSSMRSRRGGSRA